MEYLSHSIKTPAWRLRYDTAMSWRHTPSFDLNFTTDPSRNWIFCSLIVDIIHKKGKPRLNSSWDWYFLINNEEEPRKNPLMKRIACFFIYRAYITYLKLELGLSTYLLLILYITEKGHWITNINHDTLPDVWSP